MKSNVFAPLFLLAPICFLSLNGCSTTIKDLKEYDNRPMLESAVTPTASDLENRPYKVVVFDVSDEGIALGNSSDVGTSVAGTLIKHINKSNAEIVNAAGLTELKTALENSDSEYKTTSKADYAVTGHIRVANYRKEFHKARAYKDKKGEIHVIEPYCAHHALVQGNIYVHSLSDMKNAHTINISGGADRKVKVKGRYQSSCNNLTANEIHSLVRSAGIKAADREDVTFQNFFQPKGYVLKRRTNGKINLFKISLGQSNGAIEGQKAEFYTLSQSDHPITKQPVTSEARLGEGAVSNQIFSDHAWVIIENEEIASQIRLGDVVKLSYEKSFLGSIFNSSFN